MTQEEKVDGKKIGKHQFYFETPLYQPILLVDLDKDIFSGDVDAYSSHNHIDTTYSIETSKITEYYDSRRNYKKIKLKCKRKDNETIEFFIYITNEFVVKVGQYLSLADIQFGEIEKKYDKYLEKGLLKDFKKAIGLAAHGAGAGSFVYLRRVFEKLIYETFEDNKKAIKITDEEFTSKRMDEKITALKAFLPSQLVEMKKIYGILSKGVHELSEEECLKYFAPLKLSIELILDQKIEIEIKNEKDKEVKKTLEDIHDEIKMD